MAPPAQPKLPHEERILISSLLAGTPAVLVSMIILWTGDYTPKVQWTLTLLIVGFWLGFSFATRERVIYPLRTLSNLLAALREGDYSLRARAKKDDALSEVMREVNMMGSMLREQRLDAIEAANLLRTVMKEIDVAVFAFDQANRLKLVNRAGERLLGAPSERLIDRNAAELGLARCLETGSGRAVQIEFPGVSGRWGIRVSSFREHGEPHQLLVLSDLTRELREEELKAWQRLVRVIGHELNNSLAPIKSIAGSLTDMLRRDDRPGDFEDDLDQGLGVIGSRAEALSRFMSDYARLAKLPDPKRRSVTVTEWVGRVVELETRLPVVIEPGPDVTINADGDQLEQLLINLVRNGVEASSETDGGVRVGWTVNGHSIEVSVEDDGPGLSSDANLFVPFFTTKPRGSGVGLALCQKIAENHGGQISLRNRDLGQGCVARLTLPV